MTFELGEKNFYISLGKGPVINSLELEWNMTNSVLLALSEILWPVSQMLKFLDFTVYFLNREIWDLMDIEKLKRWVSYGKWSKIKGFRKFDCHKADHWCKSSTAKGPRTEPWGTPCNSQKYWASRVFDSVSTYRK